MKLNQIALAVAALAAAPAAFALTPADLDSDTVRLWLSGASATANGVFKGALTLCAGMQYKDAQNVIHTNPGTLDAHMYLEKTGASAIEPGNGGGDRVAYTCTIGTDDGRAGSLEGRKVAIYQTYEGGSFNAFAPHLTIAGDTNANLPGTLKRISNIEGLGAAGQWAQIGVGVAFALAAAATFGLALVLTQHEAADVDGRLRTALTMAQVGLLAAAGVAWQGGPHLPHAAAGWLGLGALTFLYGTAFTIMFTVLPKLGVVGNSAIMNVEPVFALLLAWAILGQTIAPVQVAGALVVVGTVVWLGMRKR